MEEIFKRVERFHSEFLNELGIAYQDCSGVNNISSWFTRLDQLTDSLERKETTYRQVEDHFFELKVINYILKSFSGSQITYEPSGLKPGGMNCDFEINYEDKRYLVEVKCFHPERKKTTIPEQHIAENNQIIMDGESYHTYQATRGHLIEATRHTEAKLKNYDGDFISVLAVPDGFHLNLEDFRDFVFIYQHGLARHDDPLEPMTLHNMGEPFKGTINQFWVFPFYQESFLLESDRVATVVAPFKYHDKEVKL